MKINEFKTIYLGSEFNTLTNTMEAANYVVLFHGAKFQYSGSDILTMDILRQLFTFDSPNSKVVDGKLYISSYNAAKLQIREALSYESDYLFKGPQVEEKIIISRENLFWEKTAQFFPYQPEKVFHHIPDHDSYFGEFAMWEFTFIFLYKGHGLVISGQACS